MTNLFLRFRLGFKKNQKYYISISKGLLCLSPSSNIDKHGGKN